MTAVLVARTHQEAHDAARALGIAVYREPTDTRGLHGCRVTHVVYVDGWRASTRLTAAAMLQLQERMLIERGTVESEVPVPDSSLTAEQRASFAGLILDADRRAPRTPLVSSLDTVPLIEPDPLTWSQRWRHLMGLCPRAKGGHPCSGAPGRCGW